MCGVVGRQLPQSRRSSVAQTSKKTPHSIPSFFTTENRKSSKTERLLVLQIVCDSAALPAQAAVGTPTVES